MAILLLRLYLLWLYLLLGILTTGSTDYAAILTMAILTMAILIVALLTTSPGRAHNFKNERPYLLLWLYFTYLAAKSVPGFILRLKALIVKVKLKYRSTTVKPYGRMANFAMAVQHFSYADNEPRAEAHEYLILTICT